MCVGGHHVGGPDVVGVELFAQTPIWSPCFVVSTVIFHSLSSYAVGVALD